MENLNRHFWLRGVIDAAESDLTISMTPRSCILRCVIGTAESDLAMYNWHYWVFADAKMSAKWIACAKLIQHILNKPLSEGLESWKKLGYKISWHFSFNCYSLGKNFNEMLFRNVSQNMYIGLCKVLFWAIFCTVQYVPLLATIVKPMKQGLLMVASSLKVKFQRDWPSFLGEDQAWSELQLVHFTVGE